MPTEGYPPGIEYQQFLVLLPLGFFILAISRAIPGEIGKFIETGFFIYPFMILAILVHQRSRWRWARLAASTWLGLLLVMLFASTLFLTLIPRVGLLPVPGDISPISSPFDIGFGVSILIESLKNPASNDVLLPWLCGCALTLAGFSRKVRGFFARYLPFDPDSFGHMVAFVI